MLTHVRAAVVATAALLALMAPEARAGLVVFSLDNRINGDTPDKSDPTMPFLVVRLKNTATDEVTVTFDATNLRGENFIRSVLFNYNGKALDVLTSISQSSQVESSQLTNLQTLTGSSQVLAGLFNIQVSFLVLNGQDRFSGGETAFVVLKGVGLKSTDFLVTSKDKDAPNPSTGGWYAAADVRGVQLDGGREGGGSIGTKTSEVVPEPSSITLFALGGLAAFRLRRRGR